jgi:hypothetical protein
LDIKARQKSKELFLQVSAEPVYNEQKNKINIIFSAFKTVAVELQISISNKLEGDLAS